MLVNGLSPGASGRPSVKWPMCLPSLGLIRHGSNSEMTGSTLVVLPGHKTVTQTALNVLHTHTPPTPGRRSNKETPTARRGKETKIKRMAVPFYTGKMGG